MDIGATITSQIVRERDLKAQEAEALLGFGMLFLKPSGDNAAIRLKFGTYNDRRLKTEEIARMRNSFAVRGYLHTAPANAIPVLVEPGWFVNDDFLKSPLQNQILPIMKIKPEFEMDPITAFSGQHRLKAAMEFLKKRRGRNHATD
jgi:hypothetical protein